MEPDQIQKISKALSDVRRREILEMIALCEEPGGMHCGAIVERLPISQPTVSHHIKELVQAGLVEIRPAGQFNYLSLRTDQIALYLDTLRSVFHLR